ncbi:MAG: hypothetical protein ABJE95_29870 [Byssovorax sp.]
MASLLVGCGGGATGGSGGGSTSTATGTGGAGGAGTTATSSSTGSGGPSLACANMGKAITALPACTSPAAKAITVPKGCEPAIDGVLYDDEWSDGACFNVAAGDLVVTMKYANDALYLGMSGPPTCGCGMGFYFSPQNGKSFAISVVDDPFNTDGDRSDFTLDASGLKPVANDMTIKVRGPAPMPNPVSYEWQIPYAVLGIQKGSADSFKMAVVHSSATWPEGLSQMNGQVTYADDEPTWAVISAPTWD